MEIDIDETELPNDAWMVKPCEWYKEEYRDCMSFKARFNQYFIYGKFLECKEWLCNYEDCLKWRKCKDPQYLSSVIEDEKRRREKRMNSAKENDVWELRKEPPKDWNKPLPDYLVSRQGYSIFEEKEKEFKKLGTYGNSSKLCSIL
ncbi:synaptic plasticity regulator PANTS [Centruroides vittatus]|uniref:synaptic plasticity regulator PANTS n=1 Tax=Centruroides vittatus TaxID=120091 RepID=UPI00350EB8E2